MRFEAKFVNELGNQIEMKVLEDDRGVTVYASGPASILVEHTWTPLEATVLNKLLTSTLEIGIFDSLSDQ